MAPTWEELAAFIDERLEPEDRVLRVECVPAGLYTVLTLTYRHEDKLMHWRGRVQAPVLAGVDAAPAGASSRKGGGGKV